MTGRRLMLGLAALLLCAAGRLPAASAADDPRCRVPDALLYAEQPMPRVAKKLAAGQPLRIVVLGSSSSLQTAKGLPRSYAAGLAEALAHRLGAAPLQIENLSERTLTAAQMAAMITQRVTALHPDLVIWQTGNVDAAQKADINSFSDSLRSGLEHLKSYGFDVLLVAPQYRMRLSVMIDVEPYNDVMEQIASAEDVVLFPRFEIMRHWTESDSFDFRNNDQAVQMREAEAQNRCLADQMAGMIAAAARKAKP
jgi:cellobiose-specific phosphotransferase system component IIB